MIPSFRYMGGKARLRNRLIPLFPQSGGTYIEPFAGVGNVFFKARTVLDFKSWILNEPNSPFLIALRYADLSELPTKVTKEDFNYWKEQRTPISYLIEPRITFGGKGYKYGFSGTSGTHVGYSKNNYYSKCYKAKELLNGVYIYCNDFTSVMLDFLTFNDFIYCDPPYYQTVASYPNIDHIKLVEILNTLQCKWAISGYTNELYEQQLKYKRKQEFKRNAEIKSSNTHEFEEVIETLWMNY